MRNVKKEYSWALSNSDDPTARVFLEAAEMYRTSRNNATLGLVYATADNVLKRMAGEVTGEPAGKEGGE